LREQAGCPTSVRQKGGFQGIEPELAGHNILVAYLCLYSF
jgi:hypothetical protein